MNVSVLRRVWPCRCFFKSPNTATAFPARQVAIESGAFNSWTQKPMAHAQDTYAAFLTDVRCNASSPAAQLACLEHRDAVASGARDNRQSLGAAIYCSELGFGVPPRHCALPTAGCMPATK